MSRSRKNNNVEYATIDVTKSNFVACELTEHFEITTAAEKDALLTPECLELEPPIGLTTSDPSAGAAYGASACADAISIP